MSAAISVAGAIGLAVFVGFVLHRSGVGAEPVVEVDDLELAR